MKNIFVLDVMFSYGHKQFNYYYIKILSKYVNLYIMNNRQYYNDLACSNTKIYNIHNSIEEENSLKVRKNILRTFNKIKKENRLKKIDCILVMGYDTLTFPLFLKICKPFMPIYVIQHHNVDECQNGIKYLAFNFFKNKVIHLVLDENFVKIFRKKYHVTSPIEYLPHYLSKLDICETVTASPRFIIGLSNSNDEKKISELIKIDKENKLKEIDYEIVIKSNLYLYESKKVKILKGYIDDNIYNQYFVLSKAALILFPDSYNIRFSCTLLEALVNYKIVIGYDIPIINIYHKKYPHNVWCFRTDEELLELLKKLPDVQFDLEERAQLIEELSNEKIEQRLREIFDIYETNEKK